MLIDPTHKRLLRQQLRQNVTGPAQRKRRKTAKPVETIVVDDSAHSNLSSDELEDVELGDNGPENALELLLGEALIKESAEATADDVEVDAFDDLEDVDLDLMFDTAMANTSGGDDEETLTFTLTAPDDLPSQKNKKKRAFIPILKEERVHRKLMHKLLLMSFMCHGAARNKWCNDRKLMDALKLTLPRQVVLMFHQDSEKVLDVVKARKFVDGLRTVMLVYAKKFKVTFPGLSRPDWKPREAEDSGASSGSAVSINRFRRLVRAFQGSRDIQAQGLVALLRAIGVNARLVFSIQVPDHKSLRPAMESSPSPDKKIEQNQSKPKSEFDPVFIPTGRQKIVTDLRSKLSSENSKASATVTPKFPVFWAEVWNKYSKKWITVDPAVFKVVEVQPMRRKGKFEAPMAEETHQTWYVLAYDCRGVVKDVTRRYSQYYNAKTVKKRIGFDSDDDQHWYEQALLAVSRKNAPVTQAEAYEMKEFRDRHICEGIPNNMADFKNHPVYALESQLRQDEVIYPNDESSKCGTFRLSNKNSTIPIYKRSHVFPLKTPKAWHMKGRVLKVGARPLKTKPLKSGGLYAEGSADLDDEVRLYAEFQTELFRPPPIVDGIIEKNAYGNVEIFTPTMMPENGYLARVTPTVTIKMLEKAAKYILKIDYAKAIVSFDFGNSSKSKRAPTATEGGILIDKQYQAALNVVLEALQEEEEENKRNERELSALKYWNFFLKKLQIMHRLDKQHGLIDSDDELVAPKMESYPDSEDARNDQGGMEGSASEGEGYYSVGSEDENSYNGNYSENEQYVPRPTRRRQVEVEEASNDDEGGFLLELAIDSKEGSVSDNEGGGFFIETGNENDMNDKAENEMTEGELEDESIENIADSADHEDRLSLSRQDSEEPDIYDENDATSNETTPVPKGNVKNSPKSHSSLDESLSDRTRRGADSNTVTTDGIKCKFSRHAVISSPKGSRTAISEDERLGDDGCQGSFESTQNSPNNGEFRLTSEPSQLSPVAVQDKANEQEENLTDSFRTSHDITHTELGDGITSGSTKKRPRAVAATSLLGQDMLKDAIVSSSHNSSDLGGFECFTDRQLLRNVKENNTIDSLGLQGKRAKAQNLHELIAIPADGASSPVTPVPPVVSQDSMEVITISSDEESGGAPLDLSQEKHQLEIQEEEAELGFEYSDTD